MKVTLKVALKLTSVNMVFKLLKVDGFLINKSKLHVYVSQDIQDVVDKFGLEFSHNYVKQKDLSVYVWDLVKVLQITGLQ